uniref:Uncharacterized protein n=1 Tax=viral metagenome TaxID=1070528 RepID=A0A6C0HYI2_9ZZZZ
MSYKNESIDKNIANLGKEHSDIVSTAGSHSESGPVKMVYTNSQNHPPINNNIYNNTIIEIPRFEYPKFRYDYGWPDYSYTRPLYIERYPNLYKVRDDDRISQFFIGSVTVVGLFILYRILEKNK